MPRLVTSSRIVSRAAARKAERPRVGVMIMPVVSLDEWEADAMRQQAELLADSLADLERGVVTAGGMSPELVAEAERNGAALTTGYSLTTGERHLMVNTPNGPTRFRPVTR
jgi:alkanesulfonate monooxygenase SsuD/methylene tetrahydromethanopterin reductase-like flavin-dependent oxidoreductase (luciferase family)